MSLILYWLANYGYKPTGYFFCKQSLSNYIKPSCLANWSKTVMIAFSTYIFSFFVFPNHSFGVSWQTNQDAMIYHEKIKKNTYSIIFHTNHFIKNSEYFGPFLTGHTLAGYQLYPYIAYHPYADITAKIGIFAQKHWNSCHFFDQAMPMVTLKFHHKNHRFLMGNYIDNAHKTLIQPLQDPEKKFTKLPIAGMQYRFNHELFAIKSWLDWITWLNTAKRIPEELLFGIALDYQIIKTIYMEAALPVQATLYHSGGQGIHVQDFSCLVSAFGLTLNWGNMNIIGLKGIALTTYWLNNQYIKPIKRTFRQGHGILGKIQLRTIWNTDFGISFWHGKGFSSENIGHPLYQSMKIVHNKVVYQQQYRDLLFLHIVYSYQLPIENLSFYITLDPYWDLNRKCFEHEESLVVQYKPVFNF